MAECRPATTKDTYEGRMDGIPESDCNKERHCACWPRLNCCNCGETSEPEPAATPHPSRPRQDSNA